MTVFALMGAWALWLVYLWLASCIIAGYLSNRKGYGDKAGVATGLCLSALAILVWNRKLRPWVLGVGVVLHLGISYGLRVGFFSLGILTLYLAFLTPAAAERIVGFLRGSAPEPAA